MLRWYYNLPIRSIARFDQLTMVLVDNYFVHIQSGRTREVLWMIIQSPTESLRVYIKRFTRVLFELPK